MFSREAKGCRHHYRLFHRNALPWLFLYPEVSLAKVSIIPCALIVGSSLWLGLVERATPTPTWEDSCEKSLAHAFYEGPQE